MKRIISVVAAVGLFSGCMVNGRVFNPIAMAQESEREKEQERQAKIAENDRKAREEERKKQEALNKVEAEKRAEADKLRREEEAKKAAAAKAAEDKRIAELGEKAKKNNPVKISELGIELLAPGDVVVKEHKADGYGGSPRLLTGEVSGFDVIVSDAESDRYGIDERIRRHYSEFRYGVDIIRRGNLPNGGWEFEFSYPEYYTDGTRAGTSMGYFSRRVVGGKKVNCFISGVSDKLMSDVLKACQSVKVAGK